MTAYDSALLHQDNGNRNSPPGDESHFSENQSALKKKGDGTVDVRLLVAQSINNNSFEMYDYSTLLQCESYAGLNNAAS